MTDVATRREARRKRILENSENRLKRISGKNEHEDSDIQFPSAISYNKMSDRLINNDHSVWTDSKTTENNFQMCNEAQRSSLASNLQNEGNNDNHADALGNLNAGTSIMDYPLSTSDTTSILSKLIWNRLCYILLAAVVNILVDFKLNTFLGKAITVPYYLTMLGRILVCKKLQKSQTDNILIAALILCNIKPELIHKFKNIMIVFNVVLNDLSLYIFSFTLMYFGIRYLHYSDLSPSFPNYVRHVET